MPEMSAAPTRHFTENFSANLGQQEIIKKEVTKNLRLADERSENLKRLMNSNKSSIAKLKAKLKHHKLVRQETTSSILLNNEFKNRLSAKLRIVERAIRNTKELQTLGGPLELCKFPKEIREMIFEYLLVENEPFHVRDNFRLQPLTPPAPPSPKLSLSIFRASREILKEASPIFYGRNKFNIDAGQIGPFFSKTLDERRRYVRRATVRIGGIDENPIMETFLSGLQGFQRLQNLHIILDGIPWCQTARKGTHEEKLKSLTYCKPKSLTKVTTEVSTLQERHRVESSEVIIQKILEDGRFPREGN